MKKIILILQLAVMAPGLYLAQSVPDAHACDTLRKIVNTTLKTDFKQMINNQFTRVVNGSKDLNIGSFASLDVTQTKGVFKYTFNDSSRTLFTFGANGSIDEGVINLFSGKEVSSNIGADFNVNILINSNKNKLGRSERHKIREAHTQETRKKVRDIIKDESLTLSNRECERITKKIRASNEYYTALENKERQDIIIDSITTFAKINSDTSLKRRANELGNAYQSTYRLARARLHKRIDSLEEAKKADLTKIYNTLKPYRFTFAWFSVGGSIANNSFKLFNSADTNIATQLSSKKTNIFSINLAYNFYHWERKGFSHYFNVGTLIQTNDNFSELKKVDLNDVYQVQNANITRTYESKTTAYTGNYSTPHLVLNPYVNYYLFLFNNKAAIHLQGKAELHSMNNYDLNFKTPVYNGLFGLMLSPIDKKDDKNKSVLNVELFLGINDLTNALNNETKIGQRVSMGLRFTAPINFTNN